jgi:hypothetical protein
MTRNNGSPAEHQSEALGRWLEAAPGTLPPDDLDPEVVESVYALRPELAPAPRVTAEDILASLTAGPLAERDGDRHSAEGSAREAEVVPFPGRAQGAAEPRDEEGASSEPRGRRGGRVWMWVGGTGGLGMALVAAATLLLVVTPVLQPKPEVGSAGEVGVGASPAAQAPSSSSSEARDLAARQAPLEVADEAERSVASAPSPAQDPVAGLGEAPPAVRPMADAPALDRPDLIPELSEPRTEVEVVAGLDGDGDFGSDAVAAAEAVEEAGAPAAGAAAVSEAQAGQAGEDPAWRRGAGAKALARADGALAAAEGLRASGDRVGAARALEAAVSGVPARVGQHLLGLAAQDYLLAGDEAAARAAAERGLALSKSDSPERQRLQAVLDGLEVRAR